jgi:hypothetical protein
MRNIQNPHIELLSKCNNLILRAGPYLVQFSWRRGVSRRRSRRSFSGMEYGAHGFARVLEIIISVLL